MGTGIIATIKVLAPLSIYFGCIFAMMLAMVGRVQPALYGVTLLLPLRNVIDKLHDYPMGNQILDLMILSLLIGWVVSSLSQKRKLMDPSSLNKIAIFLIIYTFFSVIYGSIYLNTYSLFSISDPRVQSWKNFCLLPIIFFLTINNVRDKQTAWRVVAVMCAAMFLMGYYTSSQVGSFSSLLSRNKISGTFQFLGPNEVAAFYNQYTLILMSIYFFMKKGAKKTVLFALIVLNIYCMMFMYSRAAYLAVWIGMFFLFAIKNKKLLIPLVLVAVFWQVALPEKARQRIETTVDESSGQLEDSAERRVQIWNKAMGLFQDNVLIGIGWGVFAQLGYDLGDTHNIYVKILVEQGMVGLLIFLILIGCFMAEGLRLYQSATDDISKGLGLGLAACMVALLVNNIFGNRWTYLELSGYLWIFAGLAARLNILSQEEKKPDRPPRKQKVKYRAVLDPHLRPH